MAVRGKRELRKQRNLLQIILAIIFAAAVFSTAAYFFSMRMSDDDHQSDEAPENQAAPMKNTVAPAEPVLTEQGKLTGSDSGEKYIATAVDGEPQNRFVISLLGDCTLSSSHYTNHFENYVGDDLEYPFANVARILTADDLTLANLECSFSDKRLESASEYAFCGNPKYARSLALGGVDCVSMANNHTNDFGMIGVEDTLTALEKEHITGIREDQGICFDLRHDDGTSIRIGIANCNNKLDTPW